MGVLWPLTSLKIEHLKRQRPNTNDKNRMPTRYIEPFKVAQLHQTCDGVANGDENNGTRGGA